ncbi:MAG: hypothetical protein DDT23_00969 [candidate division WS2 bacterium]|nr:hypothetical protein [Candidatus Lithacetigena glycinireducens]
MRLKVYYMEKSSKKFLNPKHSERMKGRIPWNKGIKGYKMKIKNPRYTQIQKDKISETLKRKYASGELVAITPKPQKGKDHPNWKGGLPHCIECGKQLSIYNGKRCKKCHNKTPHCGENSPSWKGGINSVIARRARLRNAIGSHTIAEWELLKKQYGYTCPACKKSEPEIKLTEDHIIPLSRGGSNFIENIQPLCQKCNSRKSIKIITYVGQ